MFIDNAFKLLQVRRVKYFQVLQIVRGEEGKDGGTKGEVVPLVQPLVSHVPHLIYCQDYDVTTEGKTNSFGKLPVTNIYQCRQG